MKRVCLACVGLLLASVVCRAEEPAKPAGESGIPALLERVLSAGESAPADEDYQRLVGCGEKAVPAILAKLAQPGRTYFLCCILRDIGSIGDAAAFVEAVNSRQWAEDEESSFAFLLEYVKIPSGLVRLLLLELGKEQKWKRSQAAGLLNGILHKGNETAWGGLLALAEDKDDALRRGAMSFLRCSGLPKELEDPAIAAALKALKDRDGRVRRQARISVHSLYGGRWAAPAEPRECPFLNPTEIEKQALKIREGDLEFSFASDPAMWVTFGDLILQTIVVRNVSGRKVALSPRNSFSLEVGEIGFDGLEKNPMSSIGSDCGTWSLIEGKGSRFFGFAVLAPGEGLVIYDVVDSDPWVPGMMTMRFLLDPTAPGEDEEGRDEEEDRVLIHQSTCVVLPARDSGYEHDMRLSFAEGEHYENECLLDLRNVSDKPQVVFEPEWTSKFWVAHVEGSKRVQGETGCLVERVDEKGSRHPLERTELKPGESLRLVLRTDIRGHTEFACGFCSRAAGKVSYDKAWWGEIWTPLVPGTKD